MVERLREDQIGSAARTLALAFHDDPLFHLLAADEAKRPAIGEWFMRVGIRYAMPYGQVLCSEDVSAVGVWAPPEGAHLSTLAMLRAGMWAMPFKVGLGPTTNLLRLMPVIERLHKSVAGPHWYLISLGTVPERQGEGLGSGLIEAGTAQADAAGLPCYLETATDSNVSYYRKRGFDVVGEAAVDGFTMRAMVRPAAGRA